MTTGTLLTRVVPPVRLGGKRSLRVYERNFMVYRQEWTVILSGFFEPLFYLLSIGIGLGALIGDVVTGDGTTVSYAEFVAPALLASAAMNGPVFESFNIFFKLKYAKTYDGMLATPVEPADVAAGEILWSLTRAGLYATAFIIVVFALRLSPSLWGVLAIPGALIVGLAFASAGMAATTFMRSWQDFDLITLVTMPLFLFSATFYPLAVYPDWLQVVARLSPLYQGVDLLRAFTLGTFDWSILAHLGYLLVMAVIGFSVASRRMERLLLS